jgi:hypothetical protein
VLSGLLFAILLTLILTIKAWREAKRSPYFFQRRQALQRMQSYSMISLVLVILAVAAAAYGWPTQLDSTPRVALITNAKPVSAEFADLANRAEAKVAARESEEAAQEIALDASPGTLSSKVIPLELPEQYNQLDYTVDLTPDTRVADLTFSNEIDDQYRPIGRRATFNEGFFTIYATFDYAAMADGMEWSWVWRRDGAVIDGGNQIWAYGDEGPGYVYLSPEDGFSVGEYGLEIWVNDQLIAQDSLNISGNAANN